MRKVCRFLTIIGILSALVFSRGLSASTVDDLQQKITDKASQVQQLQKEIQQFSTALDATQKQSNTLKTELKKIDLTRNKLTTEIKVTDTNIQATSLTINKLDYQIKDKETQIAEDRQAITEAIRNINRVNTDSILELLSSNDQLTDVLSKADSLDRLHQSLRLRIIGLANLKTSLAQNKTEKEKQKETLSSQKSLLSDQKQVVDQTKKEKDSLLKTTKAQETTYQKLLADRKQKMKDVQSEISQIEEQLKIQINPSYLPKVGTSPLSWPVNKVLITQGFGNTSFAQSHQAVYNGSGHNGVDFGVSMGSSIKATASGVVKGTGDTDLTCKGASYGRWILLEHDNGLSTLYGHLSLIKVAEGQRVSVGDIIALSGNTGYSTGPHLHFTVYATQGVKVSSLKSKVAGCGVYRMPIASLNSYLNPLLYLPADRN